MRCAQIRRGFTAVDVLLTVGVIAVTAGVSVPMYRNYQIRSDLDLAVVQTLQGLSTAQLQSQTGQQDGVWGYQIPTGTVFLGEAYAVRDTDVDKTISLPPSISVYGVEEVVFSRVDGTPSPTGDIVLEAANGETRTITVSTDGTLAAGDIESPDFGQDTGADTGSDTGATTGGDTGDTGTTGGDTGDTGTTGGDSGGDSGSDSGGDSGGGSGGGGGDDDDDNDPTCEDRFSVASDGSITTTGTVSVTVKALGAAITYGSGGPEVQVTAKISTDGGSVWNHLFNGAEIDGGEQQTVSDITSGQQIAVQVNGRYGWLFNKTYESNDETGHVIVLRNGSELPDYDAFDNQGGLESFLQSVIGDDGKISIGEYDVILLTELGTLGSSSSDFQDAVLLLEFTQNEGSCAANDDPRFKVTWERLENTGHGNADRKVFIGQSAWAYGEGQWIPLLALDGQVATDGGYTEEVEGLSVQRQNGYIQVLAHGSLPTGKELVDARITFDGAHVTRLENIDGQNKTENPFDGVTNDGAGGDEVTIAYGSGSVLFQTRVTSADDAINIYWAETVAQSSSSSSSGGSTTSGASSSSSTYSQNSDGTNDEDDGDGDNDDGIANNDNDDDGDGDDDDGIANNNDSDIDPCAAAFTINNGKIVLQEAADVSFRVLGSYSTYGQGGPEIQVRMNVSTNNGSTWQSLFGYRDIDGGETETIEDVPSGSTILLKTEGRRAWLFRQQVESGDGSGRMKILRRKQPDPNTTIFATPTKLKSFLRNRLSNRKVLINPKQALVLIELQETGNAADFQDAAVLLTIEKPASQGICGRNSEDEDDDEDDSDDDDGGSGGTTGGDTGSSDGGGTGGSDGGGGTDDGGDTEEGDPDISICHFPPGNPRNHQTLVIPRSSWFAHAAHGDRQGACEGDEDGDGVLNNVDLCPNTYMPEAVPTEGMLFKRFALTSDSHIFREGPRKKIGSFTLEDTKGCSCEQLVDVAEGKKSYRFTQYPRLERQMRSLFPFYTRGARQYGCGKAILRMVQKNAN